jgi:plasmid stability protein
MAQFTVRNLEDDVKQRLKARAAQHGISLEEEVRRLLRREVMSAPPANVAIGTRMAGRFIRVGLRPGESIPELRGSDIRPARFDD